MHKIWTQNPSTLFDLNAWNIKKNVLIKEKGGGSAFTYRQCIFRVKGGFHLFFHDFLQLKNGRIQKRRAACLHGALFYSHLNSSLPHHNSQVVSTHLLITILFVLFRLITIWFNDTSLHFLKYIRDCKEK